MATPLRFHFPTPLCGNVITTAQFPAGYQPIIPFAQPAFTTCDLGEFFIQSIYGDDYLIELRSFNVMRNGYIELITEKPCVSLAMFLKGYARLQLVGDVEVNLAARSYTMLYLPKGQQKIELTKGHYVWFCVVPPHYYLMNTVAEHTAFQELKQYLKEERPHGLALTSLSLPYGILKIIKKLEKTFKRGASLDFELRRCILEVLHLYHDQYLLKEQQTVNYVTTHDKAIAARAYILQNLGDVNLGGLNEMARRFYASIKPLNKAFQSLTGKTVAQFIADERMNKAYALLMKNEMPVYEIGEAVGYSDTSNFIRRFKKTYGYSPRHLKNKDTKK
ncbi:helix-turn-helix transcriptional regulator [Terrimonas pollutisoli]|uniref:helix-turn-helix transcriptional regulator n=1 Tax=Terrimonas pollutisoli TaxID=3034147 RepID=UPI0023EE24F5|nr:response regulator transcription factor [Terrimonas sp. H1YJ31]